MVSLSTKDADRATELQGYLAKTKPCTIEGARLMLEVAVEILAHQQKAPDDLFAEGPLLAIVRNVQESLAYFEGTTRIGQDARN